MGSSDRSPFNFLQLRVPIQQKKETHGDALLTEHILVKHHQRQLTSPRLVGTSALPVPFHLYAHAPLDDSYLDKEEAFCLQDIQAAIRREQYSSVE